MEQNKESQELASLETLEGNDTTISSHQTEQESPHTTVFSRFAPLNWLRTRLNIYLILFVVVVVASGIVTLVALRLNGDSEEIVATQELTQEAVDELSSNETTIGDPKQLLNIESNAVFAGQVLVRGGLDVAGTIQVGGDLSLPGITVSGTSSLDQVQVNSLSIAGDTGIQGVLTVQDGLTVNGSTTFAGTLSVSNLELTGDLKLNNHLDAGGNTPAVAIGGAVGVGGTVTISGTDTAGTVTANIGTNAGAGNLASITFASTFENTPHVVITPVGNISSGTHKFYLSNRTSTGFTISTSGGLPAGSISFDYIVID